MMNKIEIEPSDMCASLLFNEAMKRGITVTRLIEDMSCILRNSELFSAIAYGHVISVDHDYSSRRDLPTPFGGGGYYGFRQSGCVMTIKIVTG